jgi:hypothetical protein
LVARNVSGSHLFAPIATHNPRKNEIAPGSPAPGHRHHDENGVFF